MTDPVLLVLFDNEPTQALADPHHPKHRMVVAHIEAALDRGGSRRERPRIAVPTTVRVEAGVDRTDASAAVFNRHRVSDVPLDAESANVAASINRQHNVGPADAHLAAAALAASGPVLVLTSDLADVRRTTGTRSADIDVRRV